jgi:hypothetical protein
MWTCQILFSGFHNWYASGFVKGYFLWKGIDIMLDPLILEPAHLFDMVQTASKIMIRK